MAVLERHLLLQVHLSLTLVVVVVVTTLTTATTRLVDQVEQEAEEPVVLLVKVAVQFKPLPVQQTQAVVAVEVVITKMVL
jgi:hypothetical protein